MAIRLPVGLVSYRAALLVWLTATLAGCSAVSDVSNTDTGKIAVLLFHSITGIGSSSDVPRERVTAIPYASLGVRLGSSDQSLLVLGGKNGDNLLWVGGKRVALTTRKGRIVETVGFARNLSGIQTGPGTNPESGTVSYLYDFAEQSRYGVAVRCSRTGLGRERIVILGVPHDTDHVSEECAAPEIGWSFQDEFWSDSSGFVWKSLQYAAPGLDAFEVEVMRPAE